MADEVSIKEHEQLCARVRELLTGRLEAERELRELQLEAEQRALALATSALEYKHDAFLRAHDLLELRTRSIETKVNTIETKASQWSVMIVAAVAIASALISLVSIFRHMP